MNLQDLFGKYQKYETVREITGLLDNYAQSKLNLRNLKGSSRAIIPALIHQWIHKDQLHILTDREEAVYFLNDLQSFVDEKRIFFFPSPYKKDNPAERHNPSALERIETLDAIRMPSKSGRIIITYPEALCEYIVTREELQENTSLLKVNDRLDLDFLMEFLFEYGFERTEFVGEAGFFSVRGGIIDVWSYANALPYRIELLGNKIDSIREFDPESQLSVKKLDHISIVPNLEEKKTLEKYISFL